MSAFQDYARNLYGPKMLGELSLVLFRINTAGAVVAADSSPETTSASAGAGVYDLTFPAGERGLVIGQPALVTTASDGVFVEVKAFSPTAGTMQLELSDEADLASSEEIHVALLIGRF